MLSLRLPDLIRIGLIVLGQFILTSWALTLVAPPDGISLMWLPDGYLMGMLLLLPRRLWLPLILASAVQVVGLELATTERPLSLILGFLSANLVESVGGALLYARFATNPRRFDEYRDLAVFLLGCVFLLPSLSAMIGAYTVVAHGFSDSFFGVYRTWYMSAGLGILFVAPLVLYLAEWYRQMDQSRLQDQIPLFLAMAVTAAMVLAPAVFSDQLLEYFPLVIFATTPILIWAALRYELLGALLVSSLLVIITVQLSTLGLGPFSSQSETSAEAVVRLQSYLASVILASMFTGLATEKLGGLRDRLQVLLDTSPYGIQENSINGTITYANPALHDIFGFESGDLVGRPIWHNLLTDTQGAELQDYLAYLVKERPSPEPYIGEIRHQDGTIRILEVKWDYQLGKGGALKGFTSVISDVTDRMAAEDQLRQAAKVFDSTGESVIIMDGERRVTDVNSAFTETSGFSREEMVGQLPKFFSSKTQDDNFQESLWSELDQHGHWRGEIWDHRKDGEAYPQLITISSMRDKSDQITGYVAVGRDITAIRDIQERLEFLAHHDALTDLPNRMLLGERMEQGILQSNRSEKVLAVLFIDIDRFKTINDSLGHQVGDTLLKEVALRLCNNIRSHDTVSRLSGDEFVILLKDVDGVDNIVNVVNKLMTACTAPLYIAQQEINITISVGISLYPEDGKDVATLLRNADAAMYRAKDQGRNNYQFYTEEMTSVAFERLFLENALRRALQENEFYLVFQPQYDIARHRLIGMETLIRWDHADRGAISPGEFIPVAEQSGMIRDIDRWVLRAACEQASRWQQEGFDFKQLSVNISGSQIQSPRFCDQVLAVLADTGLEASRLELEITESMLMQSAEQGMLNLQKLRDRGVRIAIDDFGTGYSSLSYLKTLPIDRLKIDQSFVHDIPGDTNDTAITKAVIAMSSALGLEVIAEGVETNAQADFLLAHGCGQAQGYWYSKPLAAEKIEHLLSAAQVKTEG